jgi:hypothetical protein
VDPLYLLRVIVALKLNPGPMAIDEICVLTKPNEALLVICAGENTTTVSSNSNHPTSVCATEGVVISGRKDGDLEEMLTEGEGRTGKNLESSMDARDSDELVECGSKNNTTNKHPLSS